jgi:hypothetical protein
MDRDHVAGIARWACDALSGMRAGTIVAVWADGSMSSEGLGFQGRRDSGRVLEPVATFPAGSMLSFHEIHATLLAAYEKHGLLKNIDEPRQ